MNVSKKSRFLYLLLFGFIIVLGTCINSHDTFADVVDVEVTVPSGTVYSWNQAIFPNCDTAQCVNQYSYLIITPTTPNNNTTNYLGFRVAPNNRSQDIRCYESGECIFNISNPDMVGWRGSSTTVPFEFKARLTTLAPYEDCDCPIPEPCDDPEENSRFMQVVIDSFWKYHVAFAYVVPALIAIFIVYRIIKSRLR